jgi:hypothetical protein
MADRLSWRRVISLLMANFRARILRRLEQDLFDFIVEPI